MGGCTWSPFVTLPLLTGPSSLASSSSDASTALRSFKLIIDKLLTRVNSVNGRKYAEDPTILAWETGNEMNSQGSVECQPLPSQIESACLL